MVAPRPLLVTLNVALPVTVALVLRSEQGGLVKLDKLGSTLTLFSDDKGQNLTHRPSGAGEQAGEGGRCGQIEPVGGHEESPWGEWH